MMHKTASKVRVIFFMCKFKKLIKYSGKLQVEQAQLYQAFFLNRLRQAQADKTTSSFVMAASLFIGSYC